MRTGYSTRHYLRRMTIREKPCLFIPDGVFRHPYSESSKKTMGNRITYPFAALPNRIIRGGHGITNIAILAAFLSYGRCCANAETISKDLGCDKKSITKSIKYWEENAKKVGMRFKVQRRFSKSNVIEIEFLPENVVSYNTENGVVKTPKTVSLKHRKRVTEEEPIKKDLLQEEEKTASRLVKNIRANELIQYLESIHGAKLPLASLRKQMRAISELRSIGYSDNELKLGLMNMMKNKWWNARNPDFTSLSLHAVEFLKKKSSKIKESRGWGALRNT